jgi:polyisoprenoid-binding protein YceI
VIYLLSAASRFDVKTGKAGLLGFAGHDHLIRARGVSGRIVYRPDALPDSRVEIVVPAESLEVLTPPDTAEIRKVAQAMRSEVLHVEQYPEIRFVATAVSCDGTACSVQGELTLAGQTRAITMDLTVAIGTDTLRAEGAFSIKQTDFGIRPYRGGPAGTVRVADRVTFDVAAIGLVEPKP